MPYSHRVISTLTETALFALQNGNPNPKVPAELASKLATCVTSGVKVLVVEGDDLWVAVLHPRKEDGGLALAHTYQKNDEGAWEEEPIVIDKSLKCQQFFGGPILGLDQLGEISDRLRDWMRH